VGSLLRAFYTISRGVQSQQSLEKGQALPLQKILFSGDSKA